MFVPAELPVLCPFARRRVCCTLLSRRRCCLCLRCAASSARPRSDPKLYDPALSTSLAVSNASPRSCISSSMSMPRQHRSSLSKHKAVFLKVSLKEGNKRTETHGRCGAPDMSQMISLFVWRVLRERISHGSSCCHGRRKGTKRNALVNMSARMLSMLGEFELLSSSQTPRRILPSLAREVELLRPSPAGESCLMQLHRSPFTSLFCCCCGHQLRSRQ